MRRTKIVVTLGPASEGPGTIAALVRAGMDVARLNFSHGTAEWHRRAIRRVRAAARAAGRPVAVLQDLAGPKLRTGSAPESGVELATGSAVRVAPRAVRSTPGRIGVSHPGLLRDVRPGQRVLLADGQLELLVRARRGGELVCRVVRGGALGSRKGVNLPGARLRLSAFTRKDRRDLALGLDAGVDAVALSFVRSAAEVSAARRAVEASSPGTPVLAKIETPEAVDAVEEILEVADGLLVARGDLGVETPLERVPFLQKKLIAAANARDKLVVTATEMLESMVERSRPTRAEVSDVANAVLDGTDAIMLSAETSIGRDPVRATRAAARIVEAADREAANAFAPAAGGIGQGPASGELDAIGLGAERIARELGAAVIVVATVSGATARFVSKSRSAAPVLALTPDARAFRRCALYRGVAPVRTRTFRSRAALRREALRAARAAGARAGDRVLFLSGTPLGRSGHTDTLQVLTVGGPRETRRG